MNVQRYAFFPKPPLFLYEKVKKWNYFLIFKDNYVSLSCVSKHDTYLNNKKI